MAVEKELYMDLLLLYYWH